MGRAQVRQKRASSNLLEVAVTNCTYGRQTMQTAFRAACATRGLFASRGQKRLHVFDLSRNLRAFFVAKHFAFTSRSCLQYFQHLSMLLAFGGDQGCHTRIVALLRPVRNRSDRRPHNQGGGILLEGGIGLRAVLSADVAPTVDGRSAGVLREADERRFWSRAAASRAQYEQKRWRECAALSAHFMR